MGTFQYPCERGPICFIFDFLASLMTSSKVLLSGLLSVAVDISSFGFLVRSKADENLEGRGEGEYG